MKEKDKPTSGSVKIDPEVYKEVWNHCEKNGIKITFFATEAMKDKLKTISVQNGKKVST